MIADVRGPMNREAQPSGVQKANYGK
jgi:hypothetical protein